MYLDKSSTHKKKDYHSRVSKLEGKSAGAEFYAFFLCMQSQLLDLAVKGTLNMLQAAKDAAVTRVVLTSSISAIVPGPNWLAAIVKDENCWTDVEYCKNNELGRAAMKNTAASRRSPLPAQQGPLNPPTVRPPSPLPTLEMPTLKPIVNHQRLTPSKEAAHERNRARWLGQTEELDG